MEKFIGFMVLAGLMFSPALVLAESGSSGNTDGPSLRDVLKDRNSDAEREREMKRENLKREMENRREDINNDKDDGEEELQDDGDDAEEGLQNDREKMREELKLKREAFREREKVARDAFRERLKTEREKFKEEVRLRKEEFKSANAETRGRFLENSKRMTDQRFEGAIANMEKLQTRVGEVIVKLNEQGQDTTIAQTALDMSKQKLDEAKAKIAEIKALLPATGETITTEVFEKVKLLAREAKDLLKESKEYLHESIKAIKDLREEDGENNQEESSDESTP
ncbi:hypothetical protein A2911_01845 [Candidatus Nomurabacteria bacterium RIFCSPLOWO2_01_FULL_40_15]|uniref:DUF5667 domain-containing protein n=1 Tax=Candidatus Nomurabacteria bacterium RIFCSPLOWO2_01_FULL_40_15 TaxID=1801772 RepID=A0A1F6X9R6_9BACT|nr:MAG: hypothetical protein A2911_01845 [Candidatus Nomurabacteria bacterium RIFCSPLOWO2_01_FULL_40_15]